MRPKWLLTHPNGNPLFWEAIQGLTTLPSPAYKYDKIILVALREHEKQYGFKQKLQDKFDIEVMFLEESLSQPHTIYQAIKKYSLYGQIYCKDTDNYFECGTPLFGNYLGVINLDQVELIDARNKSYAEFNEQGILTNIIEKQVISQTFCTGLYGFESADEFCESYERLQHHENLYVSHILLDFLLHNKTVRRLDVKNYVDWGTSREWLDYKKDFKTYFVDIDGVLVKSSAEYIRPYWSTTEALEKNIATINRLYDSGKARIILTTGRHYTYENSTELQLRIIGLKYHEIIYDCGHGERVLINDFAPTNPFPAATAINLKRDSDTLGDFI